MINFLSRDDEITAAGVRTNSIHVADALISSETARERYENNRSCGGGVHGKMAKKKSR